jgi:hypothetical protein
VAAASWSVRRRTIGAVRPTACKARALEHSSSHDRQPAPHEFLPYQLSITSNAVSGRIALEYRTLRPQRARVARHGGARRFGALTQRDLTG